VVGAGKRVFVLSNDVVPSLGMPVAAPGLRAFGLAEGLRANGVETRPWLRAGSWTASGCGWGGPCPIRWRRTQI